MYLLYYENMSKTQKYIESNQYKIFNAVDTEI